VGSSEFATGPTRHPNVTSREEIVRAPVNEGDVDPRLVLALVVVAGRVVDRQRIPIGVQEAGDLLVEGPTLVARQRLDSAVVADRQGHCPMMPEPPLP